MDGSNPTKTVDRASGGLFAPGNRIGASGRPKGVDPRAEFAKARGVEKPAEVVVQVIEAMIVKALGGDVQAARVVLDRLAGPVRQEVDLAVDDARPDDETVGKRLHAMLALAADRAKAKRAAEAN
jgi:hypothetical protein